MEKGDLETGLDMIKDTVQSLLDCVKNEGNHKNRLKPSIYMAPGILRDLSPNSFNPRVVSIGPLHKKDENVQAFEGRKTSCMIDLMRHINSSQEDILKTCVEKVYSSMDQIKACYIWTKTYDDSEVAKMMVIDACFILHFILRDQIGEFQEFYFGNTMLIYNIVLDLVLLENQIPFFILDQIFQCTVLKFRPNSSLISLIHPLLRDLNMFRVHLKTDNISISTTSHILSILHQCYEPQGNISPHFLSSKFHSVVDLDMAGVEFKPNQNSTWVLGMEVKIPGFTCGFGSWSKPTLRMPVLLLADNTVLILRNLIAYEQSCGTQNYITSYALAMDMLVNTSEDVVKLVDSRVLINIVGSNEEAANMINNIGKEVICSDFFYKQEMEGLNKYCDRYWPKHIAKMKSIYFSSPWSMIALLAGIMLFVLTVLQTMFTIKSS
ncbi:hypothetical protein QVD17_17390 [Tagetes erecta]|uniref:Uncharacterized protein n=1 Tax=Tagetes erecta TaxID=13708 RepID=A0AAD8P1D6_TARER|nr:hypothetical protein QVD17_17390 [Tagetes erecta]